MKKINDNIKLIIGIIVAIVISSMISIKAATTLSSTSVYYDTSKSGGSSSNVNGAIDELYSLTTDREKLKTDIVNIIYPVGSIYMSTEDDTVEKVQDKFGGTWVRYAEGTMLMSVDSNHAVNTTGGSSSVTLSTENLPSHSHSFTAKGSVTSTFSGIRAATENSGYHRHSLSKSVYNGGGVNYYTISVGSGSQILYYDGTYYTNYDGTHSHYFTPSGNVYSTFTGEASSSSNTGEGKEVNIQNPYTAVYMYKRTA